VIDRLTAADLIPEIISETQGEVIGTGGVTCNVDHTFLTAKSVQFDAVYIANGSNKKFNKDAAYFIDEAFSHYKPIGATHQGIQFLTVNKFDGKPGVITGYDIRNFPDEFIRAIAAHRFWNRKIV